MKQHILVQKYKKFLHQNMCCWYSRESACQVIPVNTLAYVLVEKQQNT